MTWHLLEVRYRDNQDAVPAFKELMTHRKDPAKINIRHVVKSPQWQRCLPQIMNKGINDGVLLLLWKLREKLASLWGFSKLMIVTRGCHTLSSSFPTTQALPLRLRKRATLVFLKSQPLNSDPESLVGSPYDSLFLWLKEWMILPRIISGKGSVST